MMPKQPTYDFNKLDYDVTTDQPLDHEVWNARAGRRGMALIELQVCNSHRLGDI